MKPDEAHPLNLFRVHWYNDTDRSQQGAVPAHVVLGKELTGVEAKIVVALGDRFPMIRAHKVLAAYGCLAPRVVTGQFDPTSHRAIWPSTGNYCRGGVAISRLMGCRGVAVLPEGMSRERFAWLEDWVTDPADVIATPGSESNVKEIYDKCAELSADPANVIFNQFSEFGNYLVHYQCTGAALGDVFEHLREADAGLRLRAFVSASGLGRHSGRGRPPEGRLRRPHRGGRGARVPDDALQRLRRAQHPGHRRQAHTPHPQRLQHRHRHRRQRPGHGPSLRALLVARRDWPTWRTAATSPRRSSEH